ncbi:MAG: hypothetical protein ACYC61_24360 [Isosphaeraceae bacterium]
MLIDTDRNGKSASRFMRKYHLQVHMSADRPELMADWTVAQICHVNLEVIGLWVESGAWPLPEVVHATTLYFRTLDVERWLDSGTWPTGLHFRDVPFPVGDRASWRRGQGTYCRSDPASAE